MTRPTPIPYVDELLGGTMLYEEQRGDFAQARLEAERQLDAARRSADQYQLADALLARGIVHLLQGEMTDARSCFNESQQRATGDAAREWRAHAYAYHALVLGYNVFPDGSTGGSRDLDARIEIMPHAQAITQHVGSPGTELEFAL